MRSLHRQYKQRIKRAKYRLNVIKELLSTEETYVRDLTNLNDLILQPIVQSIKEFQVDTQMSKSLLEMVRCLERIRETNAEILVVFQIRMKSLEYNCAFFKDFDSCYIHQFSTYFTYC
jgi:hypothetical protein